MLSDIRPAAISTGLLVAFVGFASSFAVVLAGLKGVGASDAEAASGLAAAAIAMGLAGIVLAAWTRQPISVAWSTPGAALLATGVAPAGGFGEAVGAFILCGAGLALTAFVKPLGRLVARIPLPIASAMLAGILLPLALAPVRAVAEDWRLGLPIVLAWLAGTRLHRLAGVPAALLAFIAVTLLGVDLPDGLGAALAGALALPLAPVEPRFALSSAIGIALPLYVVTMASQNIPGLAVLRANRYAPPAERAFAVTGVFSLLFAPFGGHAVNLAAITAAMCAGPEAGDDPAKRYWAAIVAGAGYVALGAVSGAAALFVVAAPAILIEAVAGLALIAAFAAAVVAAFERAETRVAAAITFLVAGSGLAIGGVSGAFWGLLAGIAVLAHERSPKP